MLVTSKVVKIDPKSNSVSAVTIFDRKSRSRQNLLRISKFVFAGVVRVSEDGRWVDEALRDLGEEFLDEAVRETDGGRVGVAVGVEDGLAEVRGRVYQVFGATRWCFVC